MRDDIEQKYNKGTSYKYTLYAVIVHSGSFEGGHYYAYVKWADQ